MIIKDEGIINGIVYDQTIYNNSNNRFYPTLRGLHRLVDLICEAKATPTQYLKINPFYRNSRKNWQIEYDEEYMFYLETRENIAIDDQDKQICDCYGTSTLSSEQARIGRILFPLCQKDDVDSLAKALNNYLHFLEESIPTLIQDLLTRQHIDFQDLGFGHFEFEIHSD